MARVLLAVYGIKVTQRGNQQIPSGFGNGSDLLKLYDEWVRKICIERIIEKQNPKTDDKRHISCDPTSIKNVDARSIMGCFIVGKNGESFNVAEYDENLQQKTDSLVTPDKFVDRRAFFYLTVPTGHSLGYLVLQVPSSGGVKEALHLAFRSFWKAKGLGHYTLGFSGLINGKLFNRMLEKGVLKEITFTQNGIPANIEKFKNRSERTPVNSGTMKTTFTSDNMNWAGPIAAGFMERRRKREIATGLDAKNVLEFQQDLEYNEISVKLELGGQTKTFHVVHESRTAPEIDVTSNLKGDHSMTKILEEAVKLVESVSLVVKKDELPPQHT